MKIPGKKTFGFSYETRVFVSGVEPLSSAGGVLNVGDEVTQVRNNVWVGRNCFP